jgi:hypothetical protein
MRALKIAGCCLASVLTWLVASPAKCADISIAFAETKADPALVVVSGPIVAGDGQKFRQLTAFISQGVVAFGSDGGVIIEAIDIGTAIRLKGFATLIPDEVRCASACALAWLGGVERYAGPKATIGFHAAFASDTGATSGMGNALVGAYLNQIGLPMAAIAYITQSEPSAMTWLNWRDATNYGIAVKPFIASPTSASPPSTPSSPPSSPPPSSTVSFVEGTKSFVARVVGAWGSPDRSVYGDIVNYYGKPTAVAAVLADKNKFAQRWPERHYALTWSTVDCQPNNSGDEVCKLDGEGTWEVKNAQKVARGTMRMTYKVLWRRDGTPQILEENSAVVSREPQQGATRDTPWWNPFGLKF